MTSADAWPSQEGAGRDGGPQSSRRGSRITAYWVLPIALVVVTMAVWLSIVLDAR